MASSIWLQDITRERLLYLGRTLREIYHAKLAWQFPALRFVVQFDESPDLPLELTRSPSTKSPAPNNALQRTAHGGRRFSALHVHLAMSRR